MKEFEFLKEAGIESVHCIGIGGIGVSGLAAILLQCGFQVTGSDSNHSPTIDYLESIGADIKEDSKAQVAKTDCVIYSRAISPNRPDMKEAKKRGIPTYSRGEFLAAIVGDNRSLVVAGSHGKSTTSGWASFSMQEANVPMNAYVGAVTEGNISSVYMSKPRAPWVIESDESDGSCFLLSPSCLVITNIDADHLETYEGSLAVLQDRMVQWANAMDASGLVIACVDDPGVQAILPRLKTPVLTYGFSDRADFQLLCCEQNGAVSKLRWRKPNGEEVTTKTKIPGRHNALNGLAAWIAVSEFSLLPSTELTPAWSKYPGVKRRMSIHGTFSCDTGEALIVEDYGHHPREMQVTLDAVQLAWPQKRVVMLFQPHRYTRTRDLFDEFVSVLKGVEKLYLLPIYAAGEEQNIEMDSKKLAAAIEASGAQKPGLYNSLEDAELALQQLLRPGDILLLQGAGSVGRLASKFCVSQQAGSEYAKEEKTTAKKQPPLG